jgi:hypothetical protein
MEVDGQFHALAALSAGKITWYPLNERLGGLLTWSGHFGEELSSLCWNLKPWIMRSIN